MRFIFARLFAVVFSRLFVTRRRMRRGNHTPDYFPHTLYFAHHVGRAGVLRPVYLRVRLPSGGTEQLKVTLLRGRGAVCRLGSPVPLASICRQSPPY